MEERGGKAMESNRREDETQKAMEDGREVGLGILRDNIKAKR